MHVLTDNSNLALKQRVRLLALEAMGIDSPRVLDCFSGEGHIWNNLKKKLWIRWDKKKIPGVIKGDSISALAENLSKYDIIDLDAYGQPWGHFYAFVRNDTWKRICVAPTFASTVLGMMPDALANIVGLGSSVSVSKIMLGSGSGDKHQQCLTLAFMTCFQINSIICEDAWFGSHGNATYWSMILRRE